MIHPNEYNSTTSQDVMLVLLVSLRYTPLTIDCSWLSSVLQELQTDVVGSVDPTFLAGKGLNPYDIIHIVTEYNEYDEALG